MPQKTAIIIGAGPAGLTAAYELLHRTDIRPIVYESSDIVGGIARTVNYKGNRIDIGGHRFFSKSDRVMQWWQNILPLQGAAVDGERVIDISYHNRHRSIRADKGGPNPETSDNVMLVRNRVSRIFYLRKFFDYPISLSLGTIRNLGVRRLTKILFSYLKARAFPIREEKSLEDFFINRFGRELYLTFFKDYTEKVWGLPCNQINPEWGAQRIKGLSITRAILHSARRIFVRGHSLGQKKTETSLIERFIYPKYGPGQMWEEVARIVREKGGEVYLNHTVVGLEDRGSRIVSVQIRDEASGTIIRKEAAFVFSTMPVKELVRAMQSGGIDVPADVRQISEGLVYRDFITVGLLSKKLKIAANGKSNGGGDLIPDNWIYIQEPDVKVGRLQIFNNWSPYMVQNRETVWLGLEYFCNEGDDIWARSDRDLAEFAAEELAKIDIIERQDVIDNVVIRMPKTYPAYFGTYNRFEVIRRFLDTYDNLFPVGRNGMHRYNNQDHSMLTAIAAVENIIAGVTSKENIWAVNTEEDYHEEK